MRPLVLTGFMGSGKSTLGRIISLELKGKFIDADTFFAKHSGLAPPFYIRRFGIRSFRRLEKHFLRHIFAKNPQVISTGGGVVLDKMNRRLLLHSGFVVWIHTPLPLTLARLNKRVLRPMIPRPISLDPLKKLYLARKPFYKQCHLKVFNVFKPPKEVAIQIIHRYKENSAIVLGT